MYLFLLAHMRQCVSLQWLLAQRAMLERNSLRVEQLQELQDPGSRQLQLFARRVP